MFDNNNLKQMGCMQGKTKQKSQQNVQAIEHDQPGDVFVQRQISFEPVVHKKQTIKTKSQQNSIHQKQYVENKPVDKELIIKRYQIRVKQNANKILSINSYHYDTLLTHNPQSLQNEDTNLVKVKF